MVMMSKKQSQATVGHGDMSIHRSGAVARMLGMPVATLRVWERRYGLTQPAMSPGGQRLYSADDVRRLALVKQLADLGHAIGSLARLDMARLQGVAATHAQVRASTREGRREDAAPGSSARPWRLAVIGAGLGKRLQRPALLRRLGRPVVLLGPFDSAAQAAAELRHTDLDALLIHEPQVQVGWLASMAAAAPAFAGVPKAVFYGFAADAACEALATAGTALLREPQPDAVLAQWLRGMAMAAPTPPPAAEQLVTVAEPVPPRRWDDAGLGRLCGPLVDHGLRVPTPRGRAAGAAVALRGLQRRVRTPQHGRCQTARLLAPCRGRLARPVRGGTRTCGVARGPAAAPASPSPGDAAVGSSARRQRASTTSKTRRQS